MAFSRGRLSVSLEDILSKVTESDIIFHYLGISKIPCIINSPLRQDKHPSFGIYSTDGYKIFYTDLATKEKGTLYDLLQQLWSTDFNGVLEKITTDLPNINKSNIKPDISSPLVPYSKHSSDTTLECKIRDWELHDIKYWESYGITLPWLKYAEIYPISHKIITKGDKRYTFTADKYAYAYVEHKEGKVTLKIYQPYNKKFKWSNKHDRSVISLWTKIPEKGNKVCICSSLKDALCLWNNLGIPSLAIQGEGYSMSDTAIHELKNRYKHIFICLDNDKPGLENAARLSGETGFKNIILPKINNNKDISDLFKYLGKDKFISLLKNKFK